GPGKRGDPDGGRGRRPVRGRRAPDGSGGALRGTTGIFPPSGCGSGHPADGSRPDPPVRGKGHPGAGTHLENPASVPGRRCPVPVGHDGSSSPLFSLGSDRPSRRSPTDRTGCGPLACDAVGASALSVPGAAGKGGGPAQGAPPPQAAGGNHRPPL